MVSAYSSDLRPKPEGVKKIYTILARNNPKLQTLKPESILDDGLIQKIKPAVTSHGAGTTIEPFDVSGRTDSSSRLHGRFPLVAIKSNHPCYGDTLDRRMGGA